VCCQARREYLPAAAGLTTDRIRIAAGKAACDIVAVDEKCEGEVMMRGTIEGEERLSCSLRLGAPFLTRGRLPFHAAA
jgi:hypothetical protein